MANVITGIRILLSVGLLFCPALSPSFFILYLMAGLSDMLDGPVARRTHTVSSFGAKLDSGADMLFAAVCLVKLLPVLAVPTWLYIWIAAIALIKLINIGIGFVMQKRFVAVHSRANKVTGLLLFLLPLTLPFLDLTYTAPPVCGFASFAAVQECRFIRTGRAT